MKSAAKTLPGGRAESPDVRPSLWSPRGRIDPVGVVTGLRGPPPEVPPSREYRLWPLARAGSQCGHRAAGGDAPVKQSVRLGRVAGIPVGAHWSVAVILVIIAELLAVSVLPGAFPHPSAGLYWVVAVWRRWYSWPRCWCMSLRTRWWRPARNGLGGGISSPCGCSVAWPSLMATRRVPGQTCGLRWLGLAASLAAGWCCSAWAWPSARLADLVSRSRRRRGWR